MPDQLSRRRFAGEAAAAITVAGTAPGLATWAASPQFQPRFAICNETFRDWPFAKAFAFAAECGYEGIEIAPFTVADYVTDVTSEQGRQIRRQADAEGLEIVGLHWLLARTKGLHLTSPEREVRRRTARYLGALANFCAELGGQLLIFGSPQQRNLAEGVAREEGMRYAAEVFHDTLPSLEKADVSLAMEPLSPKTTNFVRSAEEAVELIRMVNSPRCGLILDCNAMSHQSEPQAELIRRHRKDLIHFHANDPNGQGPGFGDLDFVPIFQALRDTDYNRWVSVEVFDYHPGPARLAKDSICYMKECVARTA